MLIYLSPGYYKPSDKAEYTEDSEGGDFDFLSKLAKQWEAASELSPECSQVRRVVVRSGKTVFQDEWTKSILK